MIIYSIGVSILLEEYVIHELGLCINIGHYTKTIISNGINTYTPQPINKRARDGLIEQQLVTYRM